MIPIEQVTQITKPSKKCPYCDMIVTGDGWRHSERATQDCFIETAEQMEEMGDGAFVPEACSEFCWRYFMELSFAHWNEQ